MDKERSMTPFDKAMWGTLVVLLVLMRRRALPPLVFALASSSILWFVLPAFAARYYPELVEKALREGDQDLTAASQLVRVGFFWSLQLGDKRFEPPITDLQ